MIINVPGEMETVGTFPNLRRHTAVTLHCLRAVTDHSATSTTWFSCLRRELCGGTVETGDEAAALLLDALFLPD